MRSNVPSKRLIGRSKPLNLCTSPPENLQLKTGHRAPHRGQKRIMSATNPTVSILMASKDELPEYLDRSINSILAQTYADFELVLIDDGSEIIMRKKRYAEWAARDARIRLYVEANRGLAGALNYGLRLCRGNYVARHDSDDWSCKSRLELQVAAMSADAHLVAVGSQAWNCRADGKLLWQTSLPQDDESIRRFFPMGNPFVHGSALYRRESALQVGGYRVELNGAEDYDFFWRLGDLGTLGNLEQTLYWHRKTGASVSAVNAERQAMLIAVIRDLGNARTDGVREDISETLLRVSRSHPKKFWRGVGLCRRADQCLLAGSPAAAFDGYMQAILSGQTGLRVLLGFIRVLLFVLLPSMKLRRLLFRS